MRNDEGSRAPEPVDEVRLIGAHIGMHSLLVSEREGKFVVPLTSLTEERSLSTVDEVVRAILPRYAGKPIRLVSITVNVEW